MQNLSTWKEGEFEHAVTSALVACYETRVQKQRGAAPEDRLTEQHLFAMRVQGPYIPSSDRVILNEHNTSGSTFDIVNDELPGAGVFGVPIEDSHAVKRDFPDAYFMGQMIRQVSNLGKGWHARGGGARYEMFNLMANNDGRINGERRYFTVSKSGSILACEKRANLNRNTPGEVSRHFVTPEEHLTECENWASYALQYLADRRFCWTITAQENFVKAHLGCAREEIKSLLYARTLPMTATGRKRPILHLVEAHQRRIRNGTDVDITAFLRGQQTVEIQGTRFTVSAPKALKAMVSEASQERYFA